MNAVTYSPSGASGWVDLDGPVHYVDHGGPAGAPLLVCVHGLGGSHANWAALAPLLTGTYRVLALDLAGFGLTAGGARSPTVPANSALLHRFLREVAGEPVTLVGNSMGALISALLAGAEPEQVRAAVLIDPVLPIGLNRPDPLVLGAFLTFAMPRPVRRRVAARRGPLTVEDIARDVLELCCADASRIPPEVLEQHLALARKRVGMPGIEADMLIAARSLAPYLTQPRRHAAMLRGLRMPVLLIHGDRDRLVPVRAARLAAAANPTWRFEEAAGVGHVPMLEVAAWTAEKLHDWLPAVL